MTQYIMLTMSNPLCLNNNNKPFDNQYTSTKSNHVITN